MSLFRRITTSFARDSHMNLSAVAQFPPEVQELQESSLVPHVWVLRTIHGSVLRITLAIVSACRLWDPLTVRHLNIQPPPVCSVIKTVFHEADDRGSCALGLGLGVRRVLPIVKPCRRGTASLSLTRYVTSSATISLVVDNPVSTSISGGRPFCPLHAT
ncbi:hypothetical protein J6590_000750 [Homalodisca vitripennis]|nr:hypothetical protein J6590_000750 [Homalodisca vitripennis]